MLNSNIFDSYCQGAVRGSRITILMILPNQMLSQN